jgi:hypothetical protein
LSEIFQQECTDQILFEFDARGKKISFHIWKNSIAKANNAKEIISEETTKIKKEILIKNKDQSKELTSKITLNFTEKIAVTKKKWTKI